MKTNVQDDSTTTATSARCESLAGGDDKTSQALVRARLEGTPLASFPGPVPESLHQAYAIQTASIGRWPDVVGGWKVGMLSPQDQERYAAQRLVGPIFRSRIREAAIGSRNVMPIFVGGFAAIEAEFVFKLADTIEPRDRSWSAEDLLPYVAGLHVGAEIASSPMADVNRLGPTVVVSDFGNNAGLLLGPEIEQWGSVDPADLPTKVIVDGKIVGDASAAAIPGGPFEALQFAVEVARTRGIALPAGTLVSTGAATGIHDIDVASHSRVEFGELGGFDVTFEPVPNETHAQ